METRSNFVLVGAVTLAILVGLLLFTVWLSGLNNSERKCYDIYFSQGVSGLNTGSNVTFSGVPVGQITDISLQPQRPEFVQVRIEVDEDTPVLQGTTAQIKGVGFTGVSEIQLQGAVRGASPIRQAGPDGCPVIPSSAGGLGALLNSAPELLERIQRLTERLTELLDDENQNAIADILDNVRRTTEVLAERAPAMADTVEEVGVAARDVANAYERVGILATNANELIEEEGRPAARDLREAIGSIQRSAENLDAIIADARPGVQNFSKSTLPEANRLIRDMRELTESLSAVSNRIEQEGIGGTLGPEKLPDYEPRKRNR